MFGFILEKIIVSLTVYTIRRLVLKYISLDNRLC